jgi:hypothetical protein
LPVTGWVRTTGWTERRRGEGEGKSARRSKGTRKTRRRRKRRKERLTVLDRLTLDDTTTETFARVLGLLDTRVDGGEGFEVGAERGRKVRVGCGEDESVRLVSTQKRRTKKRRTSLHVDVAGVTAGRRRVEEHEEGKTGRLLLVRNVRVPDRRSELGVNLVVEDGLRVAVNEVELGVTFRRSRARVDVRPSEERSPVVEHPVGGLLEEVLVAESDDLQAEGRVSIFRCRREKGERKTTHATLGDVKGELLTTSSVELGELDALDFRPELRGQLVDLSIVEERTRVGVVERLATCTGGGGTGA